MLNKIFKISFPMATLVLPVFTFAQSLTQTSILLRMAYSTITDVVIPLVFTLALLFFFWGVAKYIWYAGGEKEEGKKIMIWGIIALFVMSSVWGLVYFIRTELNIGPTTSVLIPTINK